MIQPLQSGAGMDPRPRAFDGVKVFSATLIAVRAQLGEQVTEWIRANKHCELTDIVVTQSSDSSFHCVAISIFFREHRPAKR